MKPIISLESENHRATDQVSSAPSSTLKPIDLANTQSAFTLADIEFPLFEEATQTAARFLGIPISFIGAISQEALSLRAAVGLSHLGLMNPLARTRRLPLLDSLVKTVLSAQRSLVLPNIAADSPYAQSYLSSEYGIRSYIGIPLLTAEGRCLGLLAAMDLKPRTFSEDAIAFMELLARWSVSEFERYQLVSVLNDPAAPHNAINSSAPQEGYLLDTVRLTLMSQLAQDMRNPLTTITGMASVLSREIYGALTPKQREYTDIVHTSSQHLLAIANEVLELSSLDAQMQPLHPTSVDVEVIGQHVECMLNSQLAQKSQEIRFTVEPGSRLWTLDRDVVKYLLYHLLFSIIQLSGEGGILQIHSAERNNSLQIGIKMSHPWLGDGIPQAVTSLHKRLESTDKELEMLARLLARASGREDLTAKAAKSDSHFQTKNEILRSRETLSLLLGRHLIERHGGSLALTGTQESGHRFTIMLPFLSASATGR
ncbi:MAG: GAF domain-containing sensor histidine kinase [Cyanobacteria bacterium P01_C01_bin.120]